MDITSDFGSDVPGSNPGRGTYEQSEDVPQSTSGRRADRIRRPCEHILRFPEAKYPQGVLKL